MCAHIHWEPDDTQYSNTRDKTTGQKMNFGTDLRAMTWANTRGCHEKLPYICASITTVLGEGVGKIHMDQSKSMLEGTDQEGTERENEETDLDM